MKCECGQPMCRWCWVARCRAKYPARYGIKGAGVVRTPPVARTVPCVHLGGPTGGTVQCPGCRGGVMLKLFSCAVFGTCTVGKKAGDLACCAGCVAYEPAKSPSSLSVPPSPA